MIKKIVCISPHGHQVGLIGMDLEIDRGMDLEIDRAPRQFARQAAFVDIRDAGKEETADGFHFFVAQVPTSWVIIPVSEGEENAKE